MYSIDALSESNIHQWEDFNCRCKEGTPFHSMRWKSLLEGISKSQFRYYLIHEDGKINGICPFVERSMKMLHGLNTLPHSDFNNILLDETFDTDRINDVLSLFAEDYSFLRLNTYYPTLYDKIGYDTVPSESGGNFVLDLKQNPPDAILENNLSKDDRYKITRFDKGGFKVREIERDRDTEKFYHYYAENLTHIKGQTLPFSFFQRLLNSDSPNDLRFVVLTREDVFAGGSLAILDPARKTAYFQYMALNRDLPNKYSPSYYISWESINWAWNNGYEKVSFGREKFEPDSPRFRSKRKFGAEFVPIHSQLVFFSKSASLLYRMRKRLP